MLLIATKNPGKIREIRQVLTALNVAVTALDAYAEVPEPEETGDTFAENAREKARYYSQATGQWCLADDSGLVVDALGGEPGVHSARYAGITGADRSVADQANIEKLMHRLGHEADRKGRFVCHLALADGDKILLEATGTFEGVISTSAAGENGFGYDPVFFVPEKGCSAAELSSDEKNAISHRGCALRRFATKLGQYLQ